MTGRDISTINSDLLSLVQRMYPDIYKELSTEEQTLFAFLLSLESYLHDSSLLYMSNMLNENSILTAETPEAIISKAVTFGYSPSFAKASYGTIYIYIPVIDGTGSIVLPKSTIKFLKDFVKLTGISQITKDAVQFNLMYDYIFNSTGLVSSLQRINADGTITILPTRVVDKIINSNTYKCFTFEMDVIQTTNKIDFQSIVEEYDNLSFPSITLPIVSEDISRIYAMDIYIDSIYKATYVPVLTTSNNNAYTYSLRIGMQSVTLLLSNGVYGKKVMPGARVSGSIYMCEASQGNPVGDSIKLVSNLVNETRSGNMPEISIEHPQFKTGSDIEDLKNIKLGTLSRLVTQNRLVTFDDYTLMLESSIPNIKAFATNRFFSFASNSAAIYVSHINHYDNVFNVPIYTKTDNKCLVITKQDIASGKVMVVGNYIVIPPGALFKEYGGADTSCTFVSLFDTVTTMEQLKYYVGSADGSIMPSPQIQNMWFSVLGYHINNKVPVDNASFIAPLNKYTTPTSTVLAYNVYGVNTSVLFGDMHTTFDIARCKEIFSFNIAIVLSNTTDEQFREFIGDASWWSVTVNSYTIDNTDTNLVKITYNELLRTIELSFTLPYEPKIRERQDFTVVLKAKPVGTQFNMIDVALAKYLSCNMLSHPFKCNLPKVGYSTNAKVWSVHNGVPLDANDIEFLIMDMPCISLTEMSPYTSAKFDFLKEIRSIFATICKFVHTKAPLATTYDVLFMRTSGPIMPREFLSKSIDEYYTINAPLNVTNVMPPANSLMKLPLRIVVNIKVAPDANVNKIVNEVKHKLLLHLNPVGHVFTTLCRSQLYSILNTISELISLEVVEPTTDVWDSASLYSLIHYTCVNKFAYKLYTPHMLWTSDESIIVNVEFPKW